MTAKTHIKLGQVTSLISFILGTVIFVLYYYTSDFDFLFNGYVFIGLAGLINMVVLIAILLKAKKDKTNQKRLKSASFLILLNIPIMLVYCWGTIILLGTMRINFTNETNTIITDINVLGCGGGYIEELKVGESKTVWVEITGDCSINVNYLSNGKRQEETVAGYITSSMGQKAKHKIDGKDKELLL